MKINKVSIHFTADRKLVDYIEKKMTKLDQFYDRIIDAKVTMKLENNGKVKDKIVELRMHVPGDSLIAKERSKTFEASADLAVDNMKRQLKRYKSRLKSKASQK